MNRFSFCSFLFLFSLGVFPSAYSQKTTIDFQTYNPVSTLVVPEHLVKTAKYPFIDVHNHQPAMAKQDLSALVKEMDSLNMKVMVNLTGFGGEQLKTMMDNVQQHYPKRFIVFTNLDFRGFGDKTWTEN